MYISKKGNIIFTDQFVNGFQVIFNLRTRLYMLYNKECTLVPGYVGQKQWADFFGMQFKRR